MIKLLIATLVVTLFWLGQGDAHSYHLGGCPDIEPMQGFDMSRMLGLWYVIQKTGTGSSCITYNFTRTEEPNEYDLIQVSQHFALEYTPLEHQYRYTGHISVPDTGVPARMRIKFPLNPAGSAVFTVFATDFDTYAGIFTCQKLAFAHRQSATILSRHKTLEKIYVDKLRSKLSQNSIDPFDLSIINQSNCPRSDTGHVINIDSETFSVKSAAGVIRKAGEKLGDGVEYLAGGAKSVYNKVAGNTQEAAQTVNQGAHDLASRTRHDFDYATNRAREDFDYVGTRASQDFDHFGNRARESAQNINHRIRDDVEIISDRARSINNNGFRSDEENYTARPSRNPYSSWLP